MVTQPKTAADGCAVTVSPTSIMSSAGMFANNSNHVSSSKRQLCSPASTSRAQLSFPRGLHGWNRGTSAMFDDRSGCHRTARSGDLATLATSEAEVTYPFERGREGPAYLPLHGGATVFMGNNRYTYNLGNPLEWGPNEAKPCVMLA